MELEERHKNVVNDVYQEDREELFLKSLELPAKTDSGEGGGTAVPGKATAASCGCIFRAFFLREQDGHRLFYGSVSDISQQKRKEQQLESSQRAWQPSLISPTEIRRL